MITARQATGPFLGLGLVLVSTAALGKTSVLSKAVRTSEIMELALSFPEQDEAAVQKLAEFVKRTGKGPNFVSFVVDDTGYGEPGATPSMDRLA